MGPLGNTEIRTQTIGIWSCPAVSKTSQLTQLPAKGDSSLAAVRRRRLRLRRRFRPRFLGLSASPWSDQFPERPNPYPDPDPDLPDHPEVRLTGTHRRRWSQYLKNVFVSWHTCHFAGIAQFYQYQMFCWFELNYYFVQNFIVWVSSRALLKHFDPQLYN